MMISKQEFLVRAQLERETLEMWIQEEWLIPSQSAGELTFSDADIARAQLIRNLKSDLGVNDEGVGVILNLVDQVHGMRRVLTEVLSVSAQPCLNSSAAVPNVSLFLEYYSRIEAGPICLKAASNFSSAQSISSLVITSGGLTRMVWLWVSLHRTPRRRRASQ